MYSETSFGAAAVVHYKNSISRFESIEHKQVRSMKVCMLEFMEELCRSTAMMIVLLRCDNDGWCYLKSFCHS